MIWMAGSGTMILAGRLRRYMGSREQVDNA